jgi:hypothetical protein
LVLAFVRKRIVRLRKQNFRLARKANSCQRNI